MFRAVFITLLLVVGQGTLASTIADAERAYMEGNFDLAVELFLPHAENGDVSAQYNLGVIFEDHLTDFERAFHWTQKAAHQGDTDAQIRLASMYKSGVGTTPDPEKALRYFQLSAEQGNMHARANLAHMYLNGDGTEQDHALGVSWLIKAADSGHPHAQYLLGLMFAKGDRIARNMDKAEHYLRLAAKQGHEDALALFEVE